MAKANSVKATLVTALFKSKIAAESAVDALMKRGFNRDDISVLMSDATRSKEFALQTRTHAADGLGIGGAVGGAVGAVLAAIAAVGTTLFLPGINLVIAGPIAAALAGAGAGGATGGLIGALIGAGGYGEPILTGIRLDDTGLILEGAVPAALLALIVQSLRPLRRRS